jgi:hypothetical protein
MALARKAQTVTPAIEKRSAAFGAVRRSVAAAPARALQERLGNRGTQAFIEVRQTLQAPQPQTKLAVSSPGDASEREADRVADQVMRMPEAGVQRMCTECEEETVRAKAEDGMTPSLPSSFEGRFAALPAGGQPLPAAERAFFEPRFGRDFGSVRLHAGPAAGDLARSVHARAFTLGDSIVLGSNQYAPGTGEGRRLMAHELTHVVQQGGSTASDSLRIAPNTPAAMRIQGDWFDDAKAAISDTYHSTATAVVGAYGTVKTAAGEAYDQAASAVGAVRNRVSSGVASAVSTISGAGSAGASYTASIGKTVSADPEKTRAELIGRLNETRRTVRRADPATITADASRIGAINQHVASLNTVLAPAGSALVPAAPAIGPALGEGILFLLEAIAAALGITVGWVIVIIALIVLAIIALILYLFRDARKFPEPGTQTRPRDKTTPKEGPTPKTKPDGRPPPIPPFPEDERRLNTMVSQIQRGRDHLGSASVLAADSSKGVTAREFEQVAMLGALANYRFKRAVRERPFGTERNEKNITFAFALQSKAIRSSIVPGGGVIEGGDINALREEFTDAETRRTIRVDVNNFFGHNLKHNQ